MIRRFLLAAVCFATSSTSFADWTCSLGPQEYLNRCNAWLNPRVHSLDFSPCFDGNENPNGQCIGDMLWGCPIPGTNCAFSIAAHSPGNYMAPVYLQCCTEGYQHSSAEAVAVYFQKKLLKLKQDNEAMADEIAARLNQNISPEARAKVNAALATHKQCLQGARSTANVMDCFHSFEIEINSI